MIKANREILLLIAFFTVVRLAVSPSFGLGVDEAHYFLYAKYLDFSYVDHPPLVGWLHAPIYYFFGTSEFLVRLPAIVLFALTTYLLYRFTAALSGSRHIALLAALAVNSSFLFNALSFMLLPDSFLYPLMLLLIFTIKKMEESPETKYFILLGVLLGLSGLAKYTAILFVPPLAAYFIIKRRYDLLVSKRMLLAAVIALLMVSPVLYWNLQNDFVSFRYQTGHVLGSSAIDVKAFFTALAAQFGSYSPFLFLIAFYGFFKSFRDKNDWIRLALLFGGAILIFFLYTSLRETALPHWNSPFYLLFIPIGVYYLSGPVRNKKKIFLNFSIGFSLIVTLLLYAELGGKFFRFPDYQSPFRDIYGYDATAAEANKILKKNQGAKQALAVTNWTLGSRMTYYALPYRMEVFVIDKRVDQFDFWQKQSPVGYDLLFINTRFDREDIEKTYRCDAVQPVKNMDILLNGGKVNSVDFVWCRNFRGERQ
ncbi:MAG: dolichyl-phosphate-mannose--protein mannosyltransferase [Deltaproteobacteria bacterium HGW-Deltaproteobacteria-9]|nr:MAG: dolichyl-phosphate-mannose--protein mannosyltransferase [Deltaproteobacteria bacterium HGW-Deltaproteobacteria-9]